MQTTFHGKRISAMLGLLPERIGYFDEEAENYTFPVQQTMRLKRIMGFDQHRLAKETSTVSDFATFGLRHILEHDWIRREEIGAIIVVTLCPDHYLPHISNIIQANCGLSNDVLCMDIAQGCTGFVFGLTQAFMLLEHLGSQKVVLINGDVLTHKISKHDRNEYPVMGDATAITIVENDDRENESIYCEIHVDGSMGDVLKIPAGGFRMPCTPETAVMHDDGDGNLRALDHMYMDGAAVFTFVQQRVPPLLEHAFQETGMSVDSFDYFLFHQPNRFMLQKLGEKLGLPDEKFPKNLVERFGNPSGASIPMATVMNYREELLQSRKRCCICGFGSGLAWGTIFMDIGTLEHCDLLECDL